MSDRSHDIANQHPVTIQRMRRILAVDPGKLTGWVRYIGHPQRDPADGFRGGGEDEQFTFLERARSFISRGYVDTVVCESYVITPQTLKKTRQYYSLEIIGALRYLAHSGDCAFELQTPAQAKTFASDDKLHKVDWYFPGEDHKTDAARHLLTYLARYNLIDLARLV